MKNLPNKIYEQPMGKNARHVDAREPKNKWIQRKIENKICRFSWTIADREMFRKKVQEKICERFQPASNSNFQSLGDFAVFQRNILSRQKCKCEQNHEWWGFPWLLYNQTVISCMPCTNSMRTRSMRKKNNNAKTEYYVTYFDFWKTCCFT